ncbi:MAG: circadian clock protein KaiC [Magnetococcales bacterium]|nr:circadian clock protein KaiC [Magnetococcales bacterium]
MTYEIYRQGIKKISTGIKVLDDALKGGIPERRTTIIVGGAGCGKSILSMEGLYRRALNGSPGIFVSFEEKEDSIRANMATLGWDIGQLEERGLLFLHSVFFPVDAIQSGRFDIKSIFNMLAAKAQKMAATSIVIDSIDMLLRHINDAHRELTELGLITNFLSEQGLTTIITVKSLERDRKYNYHEMLDFMADCVIYLSTHIQGETIIRSLLITEYSLRITKFRSSDFEKNEFPFIISESGIELLPISSMELKYKPLGEHLTTGITRLNQMLGNGFRRASSVLIAGTTGSAKTTLAATFVRERCSKGENVLYINFEQSIDAMQGNLLSVGIDLNPYVEKKLLFHLSGMPESMGSGEHLLRAINAIHQQKPEHVIIDAISATERMGGKAAFMYVVRLMSVCKNNGITCIMLNQTKRFMNVTELSSVEVSSMIDTVLALNMVQSGGELNRLILVLKSRGSAHSNQYREFAITDQGIIILDVCDVAEDGSILTGVMRQSFEEKLRADNIRKTNASIRLRLQADEIEAELKSEANGCSTRYQMRDDPFMNNREKGDN